MPFHEYFRENTRNELKTFKTILKYTEINNRIVQLDYVLNLNSGKARDLLFS